ncbi:MAG: hypothetical protein Q7V40_14055, partial [Pseudolabrys sp.]|nr:hypothetical protein [Pseudolabrys sp.]
MRTNPTWGQLDRADEARRQRLAAELSKRDNIKIDSVPAGYAHLIDRTVEGFKGMKERQATGHLAKTTSERSGVDRSISLPRPVTSSQSITPSAEPRITIVPTRPVEPTQKSPQKKSSVDDKKFNLASLLDVAPASEAPSTSAMLANALDVPETPAQQPVQSR